MTTSSPSKPRLLYAALPGFESVVDATEKKWKQTNFVDNAGLDVYGALPAVAFSIKHSNVIHTVFRTGLVLAPPPGVHVMVAGRSGNAFKRLAVPFYGIVDASYRGEVRVALTVNSITQYPLTLGGPCGTGEIRLLQRLFADNDGQLSVERVAGMRQDAVAIQSEYFQLFRGYKEDGMPYTYEEFIEDYTAFAANAIGTASPTSTAIAQLVFLNYTGIDLTEMEFVRVDFSELPESVRGSAGFGSTG